MSHSYCTNLIHCVFSTKYRQPSIPEDMLEKLWAYISGIAENHSISTLAIGGVTNHVHLLIAIPQTITVASAVNALKANSSRWMHEHNREFDWQNGYGEFSVSPSQVEPVKEYIRTQCRASCQTYIRRRIRLVAEEMRCAVRSEIRVRLGAAPLALVASGGRLPTAAAVG
jgi:putative transposase